MFATYFRGDIAMIDNMESVLINMKEIYPEIIDLLYNIFVEYNFADGLNTIEYNEEEFMPETDGTTLEPWEEEPNAIRKRNAERAARIDWDGLIRQEEEEYKRVIKAAKRYARAGLGVPMREGHWRTWPHEAAAYPGGPAAVYEEAIRRGVTWEEVCGYKERRWGVDYID